MGKSFLLLALVFSALRPAIAEDCKAAVLKHLHTSRDFTVKVAEAMPAEYYNFKLTPPQMSFAEQLVHLSQGFDYITASFTGDKPNPAKPASLNKADVIVFVKASYDKLIVRVSNLTADQLAKSYHTEDGDLTGTEMLLFVLDHTTHHRASAEMYLRAKGITPPEYQF
ncbi:MAG: DinB family protein [Acidobacteriaceae bacterium]|nr:DinB family protein [Acidobacteriaceae bacterium]